MKKILIRASMSPMKNYAPEYVISNNLVGNNIGNMLFPYSVARTLMDEETQIDTIIISDDISEHMIEKINREYACLVLPFANAFRISFIKDLKATTRLIERLTIPCIVVGIGAQAGLNKTVENRELNQAAKEFVKAVLDKSDCLGLRGEFTANYLKELGFREERDYTVIGCPSLYLHGGRLPQKDFQGLTEDSSVSLNSKMQLPGKFHYFMEQNRKRFSAYHYVPQVIQEIRLMYQGEAIPEGFVRKIPEHFPVTPDHEIYREGRGISFVNVPSWLDYLSRKDFSFGSRIHGNIAAILAGTPCYILVSDQRIKELADYHHIPHILMGDLKKDDNIIDLCEKADFSEIYRGHEKRFGHYLDFLHRNGLNTIFDEQMEAENTPFDRIIAQTHFAPGVTPLASLSAAEQKARKRQTSSGRELCRKVRRHMSRKINPFS